MGLYDSKTLRRNNGGAEERGMTIDVRRLAEYAGVRRVGRSACS